MTLENNPVIVVCDLLADLALHVQAFPITAASMQMLSYLELGPGGAGNTAIMAAHLGLPVACLGEVGADVFGEIVRQGLENEGIDVSGMIVTPGARTPVAGVVVDVQAEPAYLGYRGSLRLAKLPAAWTEKLRAAAAVFADGWAEHAGSIALVLDAFGRAKEAGVPVFFDPGPGNPALDNAWHREAAALATVVLANEDEARRLTGQDDALAAGRVLLVEGVALVVVKRGAAGCVLVTPEQSVAAPAYPVDLLDATGAGDSVAAAVIYGYLKGLDVAALGLLANAVGAAKVQKRGTGRNVPTRDEVRGVLERFGADVTLVD
jgi:sugar/nucleoside kinase (ribokinase family)